MTRLTDARPWALLVVGQRTGRYRVEERDGWFIVVDTAYPRSNTTMSERGRYTTKAEAMQRAADLAHLDVEESDQ